jgi:GIY-YIG catalytic domain
MGLVLLRNNYKTSNCLRRSLINVRRYYSTSLDPSPGHISTPLPIKVFSNLDNNEIVISYAEILRNKAGIYCFINTVNNKRYIGSAKDLYLRLIEHIAGKKSNIALQNAILKYGLVAKGAKFYFCVYEYFTYHSKVVSHKALTDLVAKGAKLY